MLIRKLLAALGPLLLCLLTCVLFRWLDGLFGAGDFWLFALKGVLLGVCVALLLPVAGLTVKQNGLIPMLWIGAALLLLVLVYQDLETLGVVHMPALRAVLTVNGQTVLVESTVMGFLAVTAGLNGKHKPRKG